MIDILIWFGVFAIAVVAGWFVLSQMNLPDPIRRIVLIIAVIVVAIVGILLLLSLSGAGPPMRLRL